MLWTGHQLRDLLPNCLSQPREAAVRPVSGARSRARHLLVQLLPVAAGAAPHPVVLRLCFGDRITFLQGKILGAWSCGGLWPPPRSSLRALPCVLRVGPTERRRLGETPLGPCGRGASCLCCAHAWSRSWQRDLFL